MDRLTQELVRVMPERRQKIFRELAGAREKKEKDWSICSSVRFWRRLGAVSASTRWVKLVATG